MTRKLTRDYKMRPQHVRKIHEYSHQHFARGWCWGMGVTLGGRPFALIEYEDGSVSVQYLDGAYWIEFEEWDAVP